MRYAPTDSDKDEVAEMNAAPWMLELLKLNPIDNNEIFLEPFRGEGERRSLSWNAKIWM